MIRTTLIALALLTLLTGCNEDPIIDTGISSEYHTTRMTPLRLRSPIADSVKWYLNNALVSEAQDYIFITTEEKVHNLLLINAAGQYPSQIHVGHEAVEFSPFISQVLDYCPAPGQFINILPAYEAGDTRETMTMKAEQAIAGNARGLISLGSYGGYIEFRFDHAIVNLPDSCDFAIHGNSISDGRSAEPGVVFVAFDSNNNGKPDPEEWHELVGSPVLEEITHNMASNTTPYWQTNSTYAVPTRNSSITYYRENTSYRDNDGTMGRIHSVPSHTQDYFPQWIASDSLYFTGTRLPPNASLINGLYYLHQFSWGYADNKPNADPMGSHFDIDHAIDAAGRPVYLPAIHFIRVQTGILQQCGWLGETSTELSTARDLHLQ